MKILFVGDPHVKKDSLPRSTEMFDSIIRIIDEKKPDIVVIAGDTLDEFGRVKTDTQVLAVDKINKIREKVYTYLIIGNHDYPNPGVFLSKTHPFYALHYWDNIKVIDDIVISQHGNFTFTFAPYVKTGRLVEALDTKPEWKNTDIVFGHSEILGCKMGGIVSTKGDKWEISYPLAVMGHAHNHHIPQENAIFCGSPIQHSSEDSPGKTISLFELSKDDGKFKYKEERISLGLPTYKIFKIRACDFQNTNIPSHGNVIKVIIYGTNEEIIYVKRTDKVKDLDKNGIIIIYKNSASETDDVIDLEFFRRFEEERSFRKEFIKEIHGDKNMEILFNKMFK